MVTKDGEKIDRGGEMGEAADSFSINTDLKALFGSTEEGGPHQFSFLGDEDSDTNDLRPFQASNTNDADTPQLPNSEESNRHSQSDVPKYFFFHSNDNSLRNRLYEENSFHRSKSVEELEEAWPERRTVTKEGMRRRRKDAVKLARKKRRYNPLSAQPSASTNTTT